MEIDCTDRDFIIRQRDALANIVERLAVELLEVENKTRERFDCSSGDMQEMAIMHSDLMSDLYHKFSPKVRGYNTDSTSDLAEYLSDLARSDAAEIINLRLGA